MKTYFHAALGLIMIAGLAAGCGASGKDPVAVPDPAVRHDIASDHSGGEAIVPPSTTEAGTAPDSATASDPASDKADAEPGTEDEAPSENPQPPQIVIDPKVIASLLPSSSGDGNPGIVITPGVLVSIDTTPPEFAGLDMYGIGQKFVVTIRFSEPVDVAAVAANQSMVLYRGSLSGYVPMKGTLVVTPGSNGAAFTFYDEDNQDAVKTSWDPLSFNYLLKIFGADSSDPSRAVKDLAGHPMAHEVIETGQCFDSTKTGGEATVPCQ